MEDNRNSYSNILKSIGVFGGVNIIQILLSLVKNKFVAQLLGPVGMGINGMILSTTSFVKALTSFGLHTSSVREIAKVNGEKDETKVAFTISVVRKMVLLTGLLGLSICFIFSDQLSVLSFGNNDYSFAFKIVSVSLLLDQLWIGQNSLLQGTFHYKDMALAALAGSIIGIIFSVPLYYIWGVSAIAPVIVISSLINYICSWYRVHKKNFPKVNISYKQAFLAAKVMLTLGFALSFTSIVNNGTTYFLRSFISKYGVLADLGLYTAGIAIANQYINVILQAMGSDYSPRLAAISDNNLFIEAINRQIRLLMTIATPLILIFVLFIKFLIILLYSTEFLPIISMVEWIMIGMFFRGFSWCLSYSLIAKGQSKVIIFNEIATAIYSLILSILGYIYFGFTGLGLAFCITYICYSIHMYIVCNRTFSYKINKEVAKVVGVLLFLLSTSIVILKSIGYSLNRYIIGIFLVIIVTAICTMFFNQMIPLRFLKQSIFNRFNKNKL